jgi:hypothetical protein
MNATKLLSACSLAFALMVGAPAWAQEIQHEELLTQEAEEVEPLLVPFVVQRVAVECNGGCSDSTLGQICGTGWTPIAVDCGNVANWSGGLGVAGIIAVYAQQFRFLINLAGIVTTAAAGTRMCTVPNRG